MDIRLTPPTTRAPLAVLTVGGHFLCFDAVLIMIKSWWLVFKIYLCANSYHTVGRCIFYFTCWRGSDQIMMTCGKIVYGGEDVESLDELKNGAKYLDWIKRRDASVQTAPADPIPDATYSYKHHQGGKWYLLLCIYDKSDKTTNNRYIPNSPPPPCIIKAYKFTTDIPKTEARHKNARMQDCNYQWKWMRKCYIEV